MTLEYEIKFFDYWHLSSGLSAGAKLDSTVVKNSDGLPYIPGKTIKGLVRDMALEEFDCDFIDRCFGTTTDKKDKCYKKDKKQEQGRYYFPNAAIPEDVAEQIKTNNLQDNLYDTITSTKIAQNGIAEDKSLREIEVVIPISLHGTITGNFNEKDKKKMIQSLKMIKRMGLNRNRGLGRCEFICEDKK